MAERECRHTFSACNRFRESLLSTKNTYKLEIGTAIYKISNKIFTSPESHDLSSKEHKTFFDKLKGDELSGLIVNESGTCFSSIKLTDTG